MAVSDMIQQKEAEVGNDNIPEITLLFFYIITK